MHPQLAFWLWRDLKIREVHDLKLDNDLRNPTQKQLNPEDNIAVDYFIVGMSDLQLCLSCVSQSVSLPSSKTLTLRGR